MEDYNDNSLFYQNALMPQMKLSLCNNGRKIIIDREIDEKMSTETYYYFNKILQLDKIGNTKEPIDVIISSPGGYVADGLAIINIIEDMKSKGYKIRTINLSKAYSMAFLISLVGTERLCYKYSTYMLHDVSSGTYGKLESMKDYVKELERESKVADSIILERTKITREMLDEWYKMKIDKYFFADEAIQFGIADEVLG